MNENERKLETVTCSRCGGSGHYSYNQITGTICFKCHGRKIIFTKRGRAAYDFLEALRSKPAAQVKVGDLVQVEYFFEGVKAFARVTKVGWSEYAAYIVDGERKPYWTIDVDHPKYGQMGFSVCHPDTDLVRMGWSTEEKQAQFKLALDFQDTLGKNGKPSKRALKAVQDKVAKEVVDAVLAEEGKCAA